MLSIKNMSFKRKMLLYAASTTVTALMVCAIAVLTAEWLELREEVPRHAGIQAEVLAVNLSAAVAFDDRKSATETLAGLRADHDVVMACVCSNETEAFATYKRKGSEQAREHLPLDGDHEFVGDRMHVSRPIMLDSERIGSVYMQYDLSDFYSSLRRLSVVLAVGIVLALSGAWVISFRFQRVLVEPVTSLARTARTVADKNDYSLRAVKHSTDELGALTDAFNSMLTQIEERDIALQEQTHTLEDSVLARTAALQASEDKVRTLIGSVEGILWEADAETWQFSYVSERAEAILGYPVHQWISEPEFWANHLHPDDRERAVAACRDATACGENHEFSYRAIAADGRVVWIRDLVRISKGASGEVQLRGLMVDVTEQKRIEGELAKAVENAESANQAKSDFLANMSHEIRTPMTAILGFAENMLDGDQDESERLDCISTIRRNGEYLLKVINDILDLSKIEAGKMAVEQLVCEPCQIVADVATLMRVRADAKGLALNVEYVGTIPETIQSDATRVRQILINLIGNAIKFTEVGTVRVVSGLIEDDKEAYLQFDVSDTGCGMTAEQTSGLFKPFVQADTSTTRNFGGTGLGLTISKRFAEMLGGDIIIAATERGAGTTFRATVATGPLDGVAMLDHPISASDARAGAGAPAPQSGLDGVRILLAEDGPDNQRLIGFVLKKAGAEVTIKENGKLALDAALAARDEQTPFGAILMDMQMPVMDGYEATRQLRGMGYVGPIIALTAHAMAGDREKCIEAGCDDYATKPIDRTKLIDVIQTHLTKSDAAVGPICPVGTGQE